MKPWVTLAQALAPDGERLVLRRRDGEYRILAGGHDLMSSDDERSARALAELGCAHMQEKAAGRVLVGGLGMGYTLRAALDCVGERVTVDVAELVEAVVEWNRGPLAPLARSPLDDPRTRVQVADVGTLIKRACGEYDAILLDVDNGPDALAHDQNAGLYDRGGIALAVAALRAGGTLATWSFSDDPEYTRRLEQCGLQTRLHRVPASRRGRGRHHFVWVARTRA